MELRGTRFTLVLAAGLVAAACGASGEDAAVPISDGTVASDAVGTTAPPTVDAATTTLAVAGPPAPVRDPAPPFVLAALDHAPDARGWPLVAGPWQSSMFEPPLAFETTTDLSLISQSPEAVVLTEVAADDDARLTILTPLAVGGDDNVPTAVPDDFETYLESVESIDIEAIRYFERDDGAEMVVADFSAREPDGHEKFTCSIGPDCLWLMKTSSGEDVHAIEGAPIRVVATTIDGVPYRVIASATDRDTFDRLATEAHHVAASFTTTTDRPPDDSRTFLSTVGSRERSIPPGTYVARVGDQVVEFDVASELDGIALDHIGSNTILFDVADIGTAYVVQPLGVVDPGVEQAVVGMSVDELIDSPRTVVDYEAWLSRMFVVSDRVPATVGGLPAASWTTMIDDSVDHYACGPPMRETADGRCVTIFASELGLWSSRDADVGVDYFVDEVGILVGGGPTDPARIDEFEDAFGPLVDSIRFLG